MENYFHIGRFSAVSGLKGDLILTHSLGIRTALSGLEMMFVEEQKGSFIPYYIQNVRPRNEQEILLNLEGVDNRDQALKLLRREVFLTEAWFRKLTPENNKLSLLGFMAFQDPSGEELGPIEEIIEVPGQVLARLLYRDRELMIPLNKESLARVDRERKQVFFRLAEGLLEIYQS